MDVGGEIRVLIAGDDALVRAGLRALVSADARYTVVGDIDIDIESAGTSVPLSAGPDVILCDLGHDPGAYGERLAALDALGVPVLALVAEPARARGALAAGARGVLPRTAGGERIAAALAAVAAGLQVTEPLPRALDDSAEPHLHSPLEELTPRELEVLQLMAEGLPNKVMARRLRISEHTVKFHVTAMMGKLDTHSRTETVTRAARLGLIIL